MAAAAKLNAATTSSFFFSPFSGGNKSNKPQKQALLGDAEPLSSSSPGSNGSGAAASQNKTGDNATYHIDDGSMNSQISLEFCLHILHINKESLGRVLVVTAATDMSKM